MAMVQKFWMPKYANIWRSDEKGNKGEFLMEAQIGGSRRVGRNLNVRTVEPSPKEIDFGMIQEAKYDQKKGYDFRTEQGWFHIEYNEELHILLDDHMGWSEMFD